MKQPRSIADRLHGLRDPGKGVDDVFLDETITLPLQAARLKARQILDEHWNQVEHVARLLLRHKVVTPELMGDFL